jgi:DNA-binding winged helix-turn-helix (wHTH) protein
VRRASLISSAWPPGALVRENTLDSYVVRLRRALRDVGGQASIATARGVGYRFDCGAEHRERAPDPGGGGQPASAGHARATWRG